MRTTKKKIKLKDRCPYSVNKIIANRLELLNTKLQYLCCFSVVDRSSRSSPYFESRACVSCFIIVTDFVTGIMRSGG